MSFILKWIIFNYPVYLKLFLFLNVFIKTLITFASIRSVFAVIVYKKKKTFWFKAPFAWNNLLYSKHTNITSFV